MSTLAPSSFRPADRLSCREMRMDSHDYINTDEQGRNRHPTIRQSSPGLFVIQPSACHPEGRGISRTSESSVLQAAGRLHHQWLRYPGDPSSLGMTLNLIAESVRCSWRVGTPEAHGAFRMTRMARAE